jgi:hypothetical protein
MKIKYVQIPTTEVWEGDEWRGNDNLRSGEVNKFYISPEDYKILCQAKTWHEIFTSVVGDYGAYCADVLSAIEDGCEELVEVHNQNVAKAKEKIKEEIEFELLQELPPNSNPPNGWVQVEDIKKKYLVKEGL